MPKSLSIKDGNNKMRDDEVCVEEEEKFNNEVCLMQ